MATSTSLTAVVVPGVSWIAFTTSWGMVIVKIAVSGAEFVLPLAVVWLKASLKSRWSPL